jgi:PleD family two-component response regulator
MTTCPAPLPWMSGDGEVDRYVPRAPLILIVSGHEWASRSIDSVIRPRGYAVQHAYTGKQALARASESDPEAVFLDVDLPDMSGADLCSALMDQEVVSSAAPVIVLASGPVSREEKFELLGAGAWDVLSLPLDAEELVLRLDRYIQGKLETDRLREDALIDAITGLYNWQGITRRISELGAAAERHGRPLSCVVLEIDGRDADPLDSAELAQIALELKAVVRKSDVLGRIGQTQYAIVAPDTTPDAAHVLAARLRERSPRDENGRRFRAAVAAVDNLRQTGLDPLELVLQATRSLRDDPAEN